MDQIRHMSKTIDDFRNFFRPDKEQASFDAMRAVCDVLDLFGAQLSARNISFQLACGPHGKAVVNQTAMMSCEGCTVTGHRNEFEHVVLNLINNARDAIVDRRNANPALAPMEGMISFAFSEDAGKVTVEVTDNGGGVRQDVLDRLFEPVFTTKGPSKGTGLGLYMSRLILEHMDGELAARNTPDGAVFTMRLRKGAPS
jgi:signal transduction histidine kinase